MWPQCAAARIGSLARVKPRQLSARDARRIAVRAQLLDAHRPASLHDMVRHLTVLQHDQTAAVAPNADLIAWSRIGSGYSPGDLATALAERTLIDLRGMIRPAEDIALYRAEMAAWPGTGPLRDWQVDIARWVQTNDRCRRDIIIRLSGAGPLTARELPDTCVESWKSSGWTNNKNVTRMLEFMAARGEVAVAGHEGRERLWDLAERVYPDLPALPAEDALRIRYERRLRSLGVARARGLELLIEPADLPDVGEPAVIEGVRGRWRVDPSYLDRAEFDGRVALLSPLDRLIFDRKRMTEIFDFDYQLEMYKPAAQRRWGFFALPILYGDHLVGKVDCTADRDAGTLRIDAVHEDVPFEAALVDGVNREINDLAAWLKLDPDYRT
jgi:uncharacterized protein YcaQ